MTGRFQAGWDGTGRATDQIQEKRDEDNLEHPLARARIDERGHDMMLSVETWIGERLAAWKREQSKAKKRTMK